MNRRISEGGIFGLEDGIFISEGSIFISEGGIFISEGGIFVPEGGNFEWGAFQRAVFLNRAYFRGWYF